MTTKTSPGLPAARGPLSEAVLARLRGEDVTAPPVADFPALGQDLQLALYCCYELHYRGFREVSPDREWDASVLAVRARLESAFLDALRAEVPAGSDVAGELEQLLVEHVDDTGVSHHLRRRGALWQLREYLAHRSLYHLKEADPQSFVIPRLDAAPKAALVAIQHDEYGAGEPERAHSKLFADMMAALGMCTDYGAHLESAPAEALAEVNFMSLCGLHRGLRGALVGQFAAIELTSSPGADRLSRAMRKLGCGQEATRFYDEHVEADAVHEQLVRREVITPLLAAEPELASDVVFGIRSSTFLAGRLERLLLDRWEHGQTSLRTP